MGLFGGSSKASSAQKTITSNQQGIAAPANAGSGSQGNLGVTVTGNKNRSNYTIHNAGMETLTPVLGHAITAVVDANRLSVDGNRIALDMAERTTNSALTHTTYNVQAALKSARESSRAASAAAKDSVAFAGKITGDSLNAYSRVNADSLAFAENIALKSMSNGLNSTDAVVQASNNALAFADTISRSDEAKFSGDLVKYGTLALVGMAAAAAYVASR